MTATILTKDAVTLYDIASNTIWDQMSVAHGERDVKACYELGDTVQEYETTDRAGAPLRIVLQIDGSRVKLGEGQTTAIGVDPSTFRNFAPDNTAQVDALWQRIASGDLAVAHSVASALGVNLGDRTQIGRARSRSVRASV